MFLLLNLLLILDTGSAQAASSIFEYKNPCEASETWKFDSKHSGLSAVVSLDPALSFSETMAILKNPGSPEQRTWAEYWLSRLFYQAGLVHVAHSGFVQILKQPSFPRLESIHEASISCLNKIHASIPSLESEIPWETTVLPLRPSAEKNIFILREFERELARTNLEKNKSDKLLEALPEGSDERIWASALSSTKKQHYTQVVRALKPWFEKSPAGNFPKVIATREDAIRIVFARAVYAVGDFERAIPIFRSVRKKSNELARALSELSWAALQSEKYSDAVGAGASLQAGALRKVFAPEGPMVMAMAYHELCQFPEALKAAQLFRRRYEESYRWLEKWSNEASAEHRMNLWQEAIRFVQHQPSQVPPAIASEWIRSPLFWSRQEELRQIVKEKDQYVAFSKNGIKRQRELLRILQSDLKVLVADYRKWKKEAMPGAKLPDGVTKRIQEFQDHINQYGRIKISGIQWKRMSKFSQEKNTARKALLQTRIQQDLTQITQRMMAQLEDVTDNMQWVEVEIFSGASQDMVFKNAHPEQVEKMKKAKATRNQGWSWGSVNWVSDNDEQEVWEDELGGLQARLEDRCDDNGGSSK